MNCEGETNLMLRWLLYREYPVTRLLIVMCGLPGAGKTTLAKALVERIERARQAIGESWFPFQRIVHVEYDAIASFSSFDFAATRQMAEDVVVRELQTGGIVICDDNQYYRSMRKTFLRIAQAQEAAHLLVYVKVSSATSTLRNDQRDPFKKVPVEVIQRMNNRLEEPDNEHILIDGERPVWESVERILNASLKQHAEKPLHHPTNAPSPLTAKAEAELMRRKQVREAILEAKRRGVTGAQLNELARSLENQK